MNWRRKKLCIEAQIKADIFEEALAKNSEATSSARAASCAVEEKGLSISLPCDAFRARTAE